MNASSESGLWAMVIFIKRGIVLHRDYFLRFAVGPSSRASFQARRPRQGYPRTARGTREALPDRTAPVGGRGERHRAALRVEILEQIDGRSLPDDRDVVGQQHGSERRSGSVGLSRSPRLIRARETGWRSASESALDGAAQPRRRQRQGDRKHERSAPLHGPIRRLSDPARPAYCPGRVIDP